VGSEIAARATPDGYTLLMGSTSTLSINPVLLRMLFEHSVDPLYTYRHKWQPYDIIMWDNRSTMHLALADFAPGAHRYCIRTTILGTPSGYLAPPA
jgi:taurine dioxygenase